MERALTRPNGQKKKRGVRKEVRSNGFAAERASNIKKVAFTVKQTEDCVCRR